MPAPATFRRRYKTRYYDCNINALTDFGFSMIAVGVNTVLAITVTAAGTAVFCSNITKESNPYRP